MLGHNPFYHRSIRKYVTLFGALFNDVFYVRQTVAGAPKERQKVPISYGPKEKWATRIQSDPTLTKSIATTVPRMSFEMVSMRYDQSRKQQSTIRHRATSPSNPQAPPAQYMGIPYDFEFSLSLYVRNIEDGLQIVEQILPFFLPDYTLSATVSQEVNIIKDIPIILKNVSEKIDFEGPFVNGTRLITWDFDFLLKGWLFGPVSNTAIIMGVAGAGNTVTGGVYMNLYDDVNNKTLQKVFVTSGGQSFRDNEVIRVPDRGITGSVYSWDNSSSTLILSNMTGVLQANDNIWGLESGTHRQVANTEVVNLKDVQIRVYQNPLSATEDDDYGYTTIITEFPDTIV